jgi:hypothetical protein
MVAVLDELRPEMVEFLRGDLIRSGMLVARRFELVGHWSLVTYINPDAMIVSKSEEEGRRKEGSVTTGTNWLTESTLSRDHGVEAASRKAVGCCERRDRCS